MAFTARQEEQTRKYPDRFSRTPKWTQSETEKNGSNLGKKKDMAGKMAPRERNPLRMTSAELEEDLKHRHT
jgi:hypothetical protein